jgi:hypothetical protein
MTGQLQSGLVVAALTIAVGVVLIAFARWRLRQWTVCDADVVSVQSRDSDWDLVEVRYEVAGKSVVATIGTPSELGYSRRRADTAPIKYNPRAPEEARLASSRGKLYIFGVFFLMVGLMWFACILAMRQ